MRTINDYNTLLQYKSNPLGSGAVQMNWQPVIDNVVFNDHPIQVFQTGYLNKAPLTMGSNSEEMSLSAPKIVFPAMVTALINSIVPATY